MNSHFFQRLQKPVALGIAIVMTLSLMPFFAVTAAGAADGWESFSILANSATGPSAPGAVQSYEYQHPIMPADGVITYSLQITPADLSTNGGLDIWLLPAGFDYSGQDAYGSQADFYNGEAPIRMRLNGTRSPADYPPPDAWSACFGDGFWGPYWPGYVQDLMQLDTGAAYDIELKINVSACNYDITVSSGGVELQSWAKVAFNGGGHGYWAGSGPNAADVQTDFSNGVGAVAMAVDSQWDANEGITSTILVPGDAADTGNVPVTGVSLNQIAASVAVGGTVTLTATVTPSSATDPSLTWTSGDEAVATVADGVVTGVKAGTATITAAANDGSGKSASCAV
ncbi:MAG: Ig-like domain-containing protein, partial [Defluviitaleaceae bacterium]|nr:Ig-like domain-containing protein [Defluviitaleaceae bacterium]